jgi:hypothetical protein
LAASPDRITAIGTWFTNQGCHRGRESLPRQVLVQRGRIDWDFRPTQGSEISRRARLRIARQFPA